MFIRLVISEIGSEKKPKKPIKTEVAILILEYDGVVTQLNGWINFP